FNLTLGAIVDTVFWFNKATGQYAKIATNTATFSTGKIWPGGGELFATGPPKVVHVQNHAFAGTSSFRAVDSLLTGAAVTVPSGAPLGSRALIPGGGGITLRAGFPASQGCTFPAPVGAAPPDMLVRGDGTGVTAMAPAREEGGGPPAAGV